MELAWPCPQSTRRRPGQQSKRDAWQDEIKRSTCRDVMSSMQESPWQQVEKGDCPFPTSDYSKAIMIRPRGTVPFFDGLPGTLTRGRTADSPGSHWPATLPDSLIPAGRTVQ